MPEVKADQEMPLNLRIVSASDKSYFPGLCMTLASMAAFLPEGVTPKISVIHEGLEARYKDLLEKLLRRFCPDAQVELIDVFTTGIALPDAPGLHSLTYARLIAPSIVQDEQFVYLDSDLLVLRDISMMPGLLGPADIAAAPTCGILGNDCPWLEPGTMKADDPYFCAGIMAVNRQHWNRLNLTESSISLAKSEPDKCKNYDQTVMNYLMHGRVRILDEGWGWNHWRFAEMPEGPMILHYITGGKPWRVPLEYGSRGLWLGAFERLCGELFPWRRMQMVLKAKVNDFEKKVHGAMTSGLQGRVLAGVSRKLFEEWKWSGENARQEKTGESRRNLARSLDRLDSQLGKNR